MVPLSCVVQYSNSAVVARGYFGKVGHSGTPFLQKRRVLRLPKEPQWAVFPNEKKEISKIGLMT
jgi:hypothetical protein